MDRRRLDRARDDPVCIGTTDDPSCVDMVREDPPIDESLSTIWKILHRAKIVPVFEIVYGQQLIEMNEKLFQQMIEIILFIFVREDHTVPFRYEENEEEFLSIMFR